MRKLLMLGAVLAAVVVPTASQAQFTLGARLGYGIPMGDVAKDAKLSDWAKGQIPIQLDAMYKLTPDISVGAYFSYAFGLLNSDISDFCDATNTDCSFSVWRAGIQGAYSFARVSPTFVPWLGVGIGWENATADFGGGSFDTNGFEFLNLQGGADYSVSKQLAVGPYVQFSLGQFSKSDGEDIPDKAMHEWLSFGIRGKFDL